MKSMRERWIEISAKNGVVELISQKNDRYFYVTHAKEYDGRASIYHVWQGDRWLCALADYQEASGIFDNK